MKKLDLYILKKLITTYFFILVAVMVIVLVFDYSEKVHKFIKHNLSLEFVLKNYFIYLFVFFSYMLTPIFVFISVIYVTSRMALRNELIAMLTCSVNYYRMLFSYVMFGSLIGIIVYILGNTLVPMSNKSLVEFDCQYLSRCTVGATNNIHRQYEPGKYIYFNWFDFKNNEGRGFTIESIENGKLKSKIIAQRAKWDTGNVWTVYDYFRRDFEKNDFQKGRVFDTLINLSPDELRTSSKEASIFSFSELNRRIEKEKIKGGQGIVYLYVEKYSRILSPVLVLILTILGFAVSGRKRRGGIGINIALGMFLAFAFIFLHKIASIMAIKAGADPLLSLLSLSLIYAFIAFLTVLKAQK